ncbi:unnamed protein product [Caenorhabditis brenneri]
MDSIITLVCLLGIVCALITIFLNINLVIKIVLKKSQRKDDMHLFYYRFTMDIFFGFCLLSYIVFILLSMESPSFMGEYRNLIVYLALPWSNFAACRSLIALAVATERVVAAYFPMTFRSRRDRIPNLTILFMAVSFGISEDLVLFGFCSYNMVIPQSCRANRLALLDTITVLLFDFLPSFCGSMWPTAPMFSFNNVGPYNAVGKVTGCAIESIVVSTVLIFRSSKTQEKMSSSVRKTTIPKLSSRNSKPNIHI